MEPIFPQFGLAHANFSRFTAFVSGGQLSYILYKPSGMRRHRGYHWFLRRIGLKMGIDFAHFNLESDTVYEGAILECIKVSLDLIPNKKERKSNM